VGRLREEEVTDVDTPALQQLIDRLREQVLAAQKEWRDADWPGEELRWFAELELVSADIDADAARFIFTNPTGLRWGYRYPLRDEYGWDALHNVEETASNFWVNLMEDVETSERTDPDSDEIVWFGDVAE
jgi:hypothetical protein